MSPSKRNSCRSMKVESPTKSLKKVKAPAEAKTKLLKSVTVPTPRRRDETLYKEILHKYRDVGRVKEDLYFVEDVVGFKVENNAIFYCVKWVNWPRYFNSWEPEAYLDYCPLLVIKYFDKHKDKYKTFVQRYEADCVAYIEKALEDKHAEYDEDMNMNMEQTEVDGTL